MFSKTKDNDTIATSKKLVVRELATEVQNCMKESNITLDELLADLREGRCQCPQEITVKQVTILDEMEDLLIKDLVDYKGEEFKTKLIERRNAMNQAFDRLLEERLKEDTVSLEKAISSIEDGEIEA